MNKKLAFTSLFIVITSFASALLVDGSNHRSFRACQRCLAPDALPRVQRDPGEVYATWKSCAFRGRVVVNVGSFFQFVSLERDNEQFRSMDSALVATAELLADYERKVTHRNFLWVSMQTGMARKVFSVLPPEIFAERTAKGKSEVTKDGVQLAEKGLLRTITDRVPSLQEPVLLNIDASYFTTPDAGSRLAGELQASGLKTDLVTLCLSQESPDVTDLQRARLKEFVSQYTPWKIRI